MPNESRNEMIVKVSDLPRRKSERFVSAYANHIEASPGFFELRLVFSQIESEAPFKPVIEEHAGIALAWEQAARLRDLLVRLTEAYEKEHGPIRIQSETPPPDGPTDPTPVSAE